MEKSIIIILYFLAIASTIGASSLNNRIYNGDPADIKDYPYLVSIEAPNENDDPTHLCGGFIYSDTYVVTAASCVKTANGPRTNVAVVIGTTDLSNFNDDAQRIVVKNITVYESYDPNNASRIHDIALLLMERPIVFKPASAQVIYYGEAIDEQSADIAGWGAIRNEGLPTVTLRSTQVLVVNDDDESQDGCRALEGYNRNYMMCAKPESGSPCQFDEGSPLVQEEMMANGETRKIVVGIVSRVTVCDMMAPAVYTRIVSYYSWLTRYAGQQP